MKIYVRLTHLRIGNSKIRKINFPSIGVVRFYSIKDNYFYKNHWLKRREETIWFFFSTQYFDSCFDSIQYFDKNYVIKWFFFFLILSYLYASKKKKKRCLKFITCTRTSYTIILKLVKKIKNFSDSFVINKSIFYWPRCSYYMTANDNGCMCSRLCLFCFTYNKSYTIYN